MTADLTPKRHSVIEVTQSQQVAAQHAVIRRKHLTKDAYHQPDHGRVTSDPSEIPFEQILRGHV